MANKEKHLAWAELYFIMSRTESYLPPSVIAGRTYENRMWLELFKWAGWREQ